MSAKVWFFVVTALVVVHFTFGKICVPAFLAYGAVSFQTGVQLGYGIAHFLLLGFLGLPIGILVGLVESLLPVIQGLLSGAIICVDHFPPVTQEEKTYISKTVNTINAYQLGFLLGGPLLGPLLSTVLTTALVLRSMLFSAARDIATFLDTNTLLTVLL